MDELELAANVVDMIATRTGDRTVRTVCLEIGQLTGISSDSLRFCFELASADTVVAGADFDISEAPGRARCADCGRKFVLSEPIVRCACGSSNVRILSGDDFRILSVRVNR